MNEFQFLNHNITSIFTSILPSYTLLFFSLYSLKKREEIEEIEENKKL